MPSLDSTAQAAVAGDFAPAWFCWIDFNGDPLRVTTFGQDVTFASTGDADLDGNTFISFDHRAVEVGEVTHSENGSDTLTITLSGLQSIDTALMTDIGTRTNWQGRTVRLWMRVYDARGVNPQGAITSYYTGYASSVKVIPGAESQTIQLEVENYLVAFNQASNRSYLEQALFDSADVSAAATLAAANLGRTGSHAPYSSSQGACVTVDTPILLEDGTERPAGSIRVGDLLSTRHEHTLEWGIHRVAAARIAHDQQVFKVVIDGKLLRGTGEHRIWLDGWRTLRELGEPDGVGDVVKLTVENAHTYVANGLLSHNVKFTI